MQDPEQVKRAVNKKVADLARDLQAIRDRLVADLATFEQEFQAKLRAFEDRITEMFRESAENADEEPHRRTHN